MDSDDAKTITLKVSGLGQNFTLDVPEDATVSDLKKEIEPLSSLPAIYQRLLCRGKTLPHEEEDKEGEDEGTSPTLAELGIEHRTKIMLLHTPKYAQDKEGIDQIQAIEQKIDDLISAQQDPAQESKPKHVLQELVTQICCQLDGVDIHGSEHLRNLRKQVLHKAESLA